MSNTTKNAPAAHAVGSRLDRGVRLQGGLTNEQLRAAWARKLPGVEPNDRELSAFALGVEVGDALPRDGVYPPWVEPEAPGWYECWATDDRWDGEMQYRAWNHGCWWTPLPDGWITGPRGMYRWRGPVADVMGPAPDGTDPQPNGEFSGCPAGRIK